MTDFEKLKAERKEKARQFRREAYQKLKNSPAMIARKAKLKEMRRAANDKIKTAKKLAKQQQKISEKEIDHSARQERDEELMTSVQQQSESIKKTHLRLVQNEAD
jgi:hypothetical protein